MFYKHAQEVPVFIIFVHVDDMTLVVKSRPMINAFKAQMRSKVDFTKGGEINWLLGIQIKCDRKA